MTALSENNFCILPWIHLATLNDGKVPLCCIATPFERVNLNQDKIVDIWNGEEFKDARIRILRGEKLKQCTHCWNEEAAGVKSHRLVENGMWTRHFGEEKLRSIVASMDEDGTVKHKPLTLDLRIGNTCNLQCVMCRPRDSSKWLADAKKLASTLTVDTAKYDWQYKANSIQATDMFDWFENLEKNNELDDFLENINHIIFGGGEPLLIKEHETFITKLVERGYSKNISVRYHTNGTVLSEKFLELWSQFKEVEMMISLDDWGERNSYIRYPAKWEYIQKHLKILDDTPDNIIVCFLTSVHAMNVYNLPDFAETLLQQNFKKVGKKHHGLFATGTVQWPQYLSLQSLPVHIKNKIIEKWNKVDDLVKNNNSWERIQKMLGFMQQDIKNENLFPSLLDYILNLDKMREIKFKDVYNEYYKLMTEKY